MSNEFDHSSSGINFQRVRDYKCRSTSNDQESRRLELLENQKRQRESVLNEFRNVTDLFVEYEDENSEVSSGEEPMEWTETKPTQPKLKDLFMFSEWMIKLPENFEEKWLFVLCPVGKRCLVKSSKGCTTVYGKRGRQLSKFQSALPNGRHKDYEKLVYSNSDVTILDCIWNSQIKSYFVLDILSWKGQFYMDTETSFRVFWVKSKLQEMPWISERSDANPHPFFPLDYFPCNIDMLSAVFSKFPYFNSNTPLVDGVLFYHSEAYYTPGSTPLVVWLKPFMLPEILGIEISEAYINSKPSSYVDMNHFISEFEKEQKKKERKRRRHKKGENITDSLEE